MVEELIIIKIIQLMLVNLHLALNKDLENITFQN